MFQRMTVFLLICMGSLFAQDEVTKPIVFDNGEFMAAFWKMMMSLVALLTLFVIGALMTKKYMGKQLQAMNLSNDIQVLEKRVLSSKSAVYLIQVRGKLFLVGENPQGIKSLDPFAIRTVDAVDQKTE